MLKPTEAIGKIKELLGLEFADTKKEKFYTSSLADGTPITNNTDSEKLELGDTLYVVLEDGNLVPAPAGEHTLQSGEVIMLDEESKVVEIREDREEDVPDEVDVVVEQKEIEEEMSSDTELVALKNEISEMKEALSKVLDLFQDFSTQTEEEFSKVMTDIDTLKKEPEVENIKNKTKNNKLVVENFADYRVQQLKKYFN
jgi:hypothetical protein